MAKSGRDGGETMSSTSYFSNVGGLPPQTQTLSSKAVFKTAYAVIPKTVMSDIVTSVLPTGPNARLDHRPSHDRLFRNLRPVHHGGEAGRRQREARAGCPRIGGHLRRRRRGTITHAGADHALRAGSFAYLPAGAAWSLRNDSAAPIRFHWVRKAIKVVDGLEPPPAIFTHEDDCPMHAMPDTDGRWATTRFIDPADVRYDMHLNIVTFQPGAIIPFMETHIMEHGLYVLEGKAVYRLNEDWVEVEAGDYMWLRAFCPQACYAGGPGRFRYLLYKDVNRHPRSGRAHRPLFSKKRRA